MQAIGLKLLLVVKCTIFATAIGVEDAAFCRSAEVNRHAERPDRHHARTRIAR